MSRSIDEHLTELTVSPVGPEHAEEQVERVRTLFQLLKAGEAKHVRTALKDSEFAFEAAQQSLGEQRAQFADGVRALTRAWRFDGLERRNLRDMAYLMETAPLSTREDLEAILASRAARKRRLAAV
jgi:hypothetical protein